MGLSFHLSPGRMERTSEFLSDIQKVTQNLTTTLSQSSQVHDMDKTIWVEGRDGVLYASHSV